VAVVMVVDDHSGIRRLLYEVLLQDGHLVHAASNGEEALKKFAECKPELVLLDMRMKGINGIETLQRMREVNKHLKAIFMTAYEDANLWERAQRLAVDFILIKPFDLLEIRHKVKQALMKV
jgi:two-component system response regulator (stage 0 sporulation protein F)